MKNGTTAVAPAIIDFNDPEARKRFETGLEELDRDSEMISWLEALHDSERITEKDLSIVINTKD